MQWFLIGVAALHAGFMMLELFPWRTPVLLGLVCRTLPRDEPFTKNQQTLVATIVHNGAFTTAFSQEVCSGRLWPGSRRRTSPEFSGWRRCRRAIRNCDHEVAADGASGAARHRRSVCALTSSRASFTRNELIDTTARPSS